MREKIIKTQRQLDALKKIEAGEKAIIQASLRLSKIVEVYGQLLIEKQVDSSYGENRFFEAWGNASVEAWGNASVKAWENASVEARENASIRLFQASGGVNLSLFGYSIAVVPKSLKIKIKKKSKQSYIHRVAEAEDWLERNGIKKAKYITLYKRVSKDFKTQEGTKNETQWKIGTTVEHPNWNPRSGECGEGKYHACSRPYFADEFRSKPDDKYIAIKIVREDTYAWPSPSYPHKIGFRKGRVLYECDRFGNPTQRRKESK